MITIPWGNGELSLPLPSRWRVLGTFSPVTMKPAVDPETLCREALDDPIGAQRLSSHRLRGKKALIITDDISRPTPVARFFGCVRDSLVTAGIQRHDIEILFALGV